jgi:hypothetical protein
MRPRQSVWWVVLCPGRIQNPYRIGGSSSDNVSDVTLLVSPGITVYEDHHGSHYRKKNGHPYNYAVETQTPKSG